MKRLILFLLLLFPWFLGALFFQVDTSFYTSLTLPFFAPPAILFSIVWTLLYVSIAISVFLIVTNYSKSTLKDYYKILLVNYVSNQLFTFFFFVLKSPFLGFVDTVVVLLSSIFLYYETKSIYRKASLFLIPYVFWNLFAMILSLSIYFLNLTFLGS